MVDEARQVAVASSINNGVAVNAEQVTTADTDGLVTFLSEVGDRLAHDLTYIFYHHLALGNRLQRKQTPVMDATLCKLELLLAELQQVQREFSNYIRTKHS